MYGRRKNTAAKIKKREVMLVKFREKAVLMNGEAAKRAVSRMAYEIIEKNNGPHDLVFIGIQTKGVYLARAIIERIKELEGIEPPLGTLDITFYRDDLTRLNEHPVVKGSDIPFPVEDKKIVLVDDVLYSGRTIRAAIEELFDLGRPKLVRLAVLIDRGNRELPFRADYIGRDVPTSKSEYIEVTVSGTSTIDRVAIAEIDN